MLEILSKAKNKKLLKGYEVAKWNTKMKGFANTDG